MARVTSEKAVEKIGNRYDLVIAASRRVRELSNGYPAKVKSKNHNVVKALQEIEQGHIGIDYLFKPTNIRSRN
jgi:DNA-directed RNA polymerase subunit omega